MAGLASRQHGVVARRQLIELGIPSSTVADWVTTGRLHPIHRGVYAVGHRNVSRDGEWMAAVLACGTGASLSHQPAGQLHYILDRNETFAIHVSVPPGSYARPRGLLTHHPRCLDPQDVTRRFNISVTTPTRTVWDLAAGDSPKLTRRAYERAQGTGKLDRARLLALLNAAPSRKGGGLIRQLLSERPVPLQEVRSWLEGLLLLICSERRLPFPAVNVPIGNYIVDFFWPEARFIVEADGGDHLDDSQRDRDNERDFVLSRAGHLIRRYSYRAMEREAQVEREVRSILDERLRRRGVRPCPLP